METWPEFLPRTPYKSHILNYENGLIDFDSMFQNQRVRTLFDKSATVTFKQLTAGQFAAFRAWWDEALNQSQAFSADWIEKIGCKVSFARFSPDNPWEAVLNGFGIDITINVELIAFDFYVDPSEDLFLDIIFWDGFEGTITNDVYTAPGTSWPVSNSYPMLSSSVMSGSSAIAGLRSVSGSTIDDNLSIPLVSVTSKRGRVGFKWKATADPTGQPIISITKTAWGV